MATFKNRAAYNVKIIFVLFCQNRKI